MAKKLNVKGADPRLESLFDYFVSEWPGDVKSRDIWSDRIRKAAAQPGFKFDPALRRFLVYVLVGSKNYSALASAKNSSYPKKREVAKIITIVAKLISSNASDSELKEAYSASWAARSMAASWAGDARYAAADAAWSAAWSAGATSSTWASTTADTSGNDTAAWSAAAAAVDSAALAASDTVGARRELAAALLYFVDQQAQGRQRRNLSSENVPSLEKLLGTRKASQNAAPRSANPKTTKKTAKHKAPLAKTLISKCQKSWDHYCERPSKKRLKEVFDHLEKMKESSAKTVKEERARCLRAANKEAKRLGMKK